MDTSEQVDSESCICPLCIMYKRNLANVQRWANERLRKMKAQYTEKHEKQRVYHEMILQKLRDKHAFQISAFDALILQNSEDEARLVEELELQYKDEMNILNASLKQQIDGLIIGFKQDYTERTDKLEGLLVEDCADLLKENSWEEQYDHDESACATLAKTNENHHTQATCENTNIELILDANSQLQVVCTKIALKD
jgi:hypothetical protein